MIAADTVHEHDREPRTDVHPVDTEGVEIDRTLLLHAPEANKQDFYTVDGESTLAGQESRHMSSPIDATTDDRPANLRDLGGLPLIGGGFTRTGILLRSDAPYAGDTRSIAPVWPPRTVVDLRSEVETTISPRTWPADTRVIHHPLFTAARVDGHLAKPPTMTDMYQEMLDLVPDRIAAVPGLISADGPALVHCTVGKDRTGVVIAILLMLSGVDRDAIVTDYRRTEASMPGIVRRIRAHINVPDDFDADHPMAQAPAEAIEAVIDRVDSERGGARGWFLRNGGDPTALENLVGRLAN